MVHELKCQDCGTDIVGERKTKKLCLECFKHRRKVYSKMYWSKPENYKRLCENGAIWKRNHKEKVNSWSKRWKDNNHVRVIDYNKKYIKSKNNAYKISERIKIPQICCICETTGGIQKHHPDYSRPMLVIPMCKQCHTDYHKFYGGSK